MLPEIEQLLAIPPTSAPVSPDDAYYHKQERLYRHAAVAPNTARTYLSALRDFARWAQLERPFPATVTLIKHYLIDHAERLSPTTLKHRLAALSYVHRYCAVNDPTAHPEVKAVMAGILRTRRREDWMPRQARTLTREQLQGVLEAMDDDPRGIRDRALFLVGLVCAFRQSELCGLQIEALQHTEYGYVYRQRFSKTNPDGEQRQFKVIPRAGGAMCPVAAIDRLRALLGEREGALFRGLNRHGQFLSQAMTHPTVNRIVRQRIAQAGVLEDPTSVSQYSFHSLRATFITLLRGMDINDAKIVRQTHHKDLNTLNLYDRPNAQMFEENPAADLMQLLNCNPPEK